MAILMVLLALGPFLHAHYGRSHILGFHVDGISQATMFSHHDSSTNLSPDTEEESAAVGVTTSYSRQSLQDSDDESLIHFLLIVSVLFVSIRQGCIAYLNTYICVCETPHLYALGFPPPAQAPPTFHL